MEIVRTIAEIMVLHDIHVYCSNKSWKPECVGSFNMDWRILVFYPEPEARDNIHLFTGYSDNSP